MKRLKLSAFKAKNSTTIPADQLLGQVLGDCHDQPKTGGDAEGRPELDIDK